MIVAETHWVIFYGHGDAGKHSFSTVVSESVLLEVFCGTKYK